MTSRRILLGDERGTGVMGTVTGVLVFLILVLFATQVLLGLYATSVVTTATYDAARAVAGTDHPDDHAARTGAETDARAQLGGLGAATTFDWAVDDEAVRLTVRARRPTLLPRALLAGVGLGDVVRTVQVRNERVR